MPNTLLSSLSSTLNLSTREEIARTLGESEPAVSRGFELATAAIFDGLNRLTGQPDAMRQVIDMAFKGPADIGSAVIAGQLASPTSPLISSGKKFLTVVLGRGQDAALNAVSRESRLRATSAVTLLAVAGQSVLSFIGTRVRAEAMTATSLAAFLQSEGARVREFLPAGFYEAPATPPIQPPIKETVTTRHRRMRQLTVPRRFFHVTDDRASAYNWDCPGVTQEAL